MTDDRLAPRLGSSTAGRSKGDFVDAHELIRDILKAFQQRIQTAQIKVALELNARQRSVSGSGPRSVRESSIGPTGGLPTGELASGALAAGGLAAGGLDEAIASLLESGLAIVTDDRRLVIRTRSRDGVPGLQLEVVRGGATFVLELEGPSLVSAPSSSGLRVAHGPRLLVVDDDADTVTLMRRALERRGYAVVTATTVEEGRVAFAAHAIDVVISDLGLPDGSGIDLVTDLNKGRSGAVLAIALTGSSAPRDIQAALAAGFSDHITKPVEIGTLVDAIIKLLAQGARSPA